MQTCLHWYGRFQEGVGEENHQDEDAREHEEEPLNPQLLYQHRLQLGEEKGGGHFKSHKDADHSGSDVDGHALGS